MGLYNFQQRFVPKIFSGEKTQTIRAIRAHPAQVGETLHLYTGLRTKKAKLLMRVPCVKVEAIRIDLVWPPGEACRRPVLIIYDSPLCSDELDAFARRDGFSDFDDMMDFWKGRLPFKGHIIHWKYPAFSRTTEAA